MKTSDKDLSQSWTVTCHKPLVAGEWYQRNETTGTKAKAIAKFKRDGWRIINGRWFCPICVEQKTAKNK